jgi:type II secretory pathway component GspD/PulD (secretin)
VKSGDTVVMGGVWASTLHNRQSVPVLGDLPLVGFLSPPHGNHTPRLLIFVTATI